MKFGFDNGILTGQFGYLNQAERRQPARERINAPPLANRIDDLHGNLHTWS